MVTVSIYLDGPFWVGLIEVVEDGRLHVTRVVFGSEPTDPELYDFLQRHGVALLDQAHAAPAVPVSDRQTRRPNPKRAAKLAARAAAQTPSRSTASQEAMRLVIEERKKEATSARKARKAELDDYRQEMAKQKRIKRHRGR
jgi:hypothetical protein